LERVGLTRQDLEGDNRYSRQEFEDSWEVVRERVSQMTERGDFCYDEGYEVITTKEGGEWFERDDDNILYENPMMPDRELWIASRPRNVLDDVLSAGWRKGQQGEPPLELIEEILEGGKRAGVNLAAVRRRTHAEEDETNYTFPLGYTVVCAGLDSNNLLSSLRSAWKLYVHAASERESRGRVRELGCGRAHVRASTCARARPSTCASEHICHLAGRRGVRVVPPPTAPPLARFRP
jgi:hypothetical protein